MSSTPPPSEPESTESVTPETEKQETAKPSQSAILQPKMQQKISLRFALSLFGVAALFLGWYFLKDYLADPDGGAHIDTAGWISALKQTPNGYQIVVIKPDGTVKESPEYHDGAEDRDNVWQPDGQRIFFSSDRDKVGKGFHIYRWNVSTNSVDQRSVGKLAQEHPSYAADEALTPPYDQLVVSAGVVVDFDPKHSVSHQLIPTESKSPSQSEEGGSSTQFGPEYEHLGTSYREAYWCKNHKYIVGVMRRNDSETLVIQCLQPAKGENPLDDGMPHGVIAGDHIDLTVDPKTGNIIYSVINLQLIDPEHAPASMIKDGKIVMESKNIIGFFDPNDMSKAGRIVAWPASEATHRTFTQPKVTPDGSKIVFIGGIEANGSSHPVGVFVCPLMERGGGSMSQVAQGAASSPCWSLDGAKIVFSGMEPDGHSDLIQIDSAGGTTFKVITDGKSSFTSPVFSPMQAKSAP